MRLMNDIATDNHVLFLGKRQTVVDPLEVSFAVEFQQNGIRDVGNRTTLENRWAVEGLGDIAHQISEAIGQRGPGNTSIEVEYISPEFALLAIRIPERRYADRQCLGMLVTGTFGIIVGTALQLLAFGIGHRAKNPSPIGTAKALRQIVHGKRTDVKPNLMPTLAKLYGLTDCHRLRK